MYGSSMCGGGSGSGWSDAREFETLPAVRT
jgi:hypothetical protein